MSLTISDHDATLYGFPVQITHFEALDDTMYAFTKTGVWRHDERQHHWVRLRGQEHRKLMGETTWETFCKAVAETTEKPPDWAEPLDA